MAEQQEQIIIGVEIDVPDVADKLSAVSAEVQKLKDRRDELNRIVKEGGELTRKEAQELASVEKELKAQIATQKSLTGQLQASQASTIKLNGSFREMDAQLRQLENQYKALNKADRNTAEGLALKEAIIQQKQALKEFDAELGNHQRNVGNYPSALKGVFPVFDQLNSTLASLGISMESLQTGGTAAFAGLGKSVKAFGKMFITPPIVIVAATLGAIMYAANKLKEAFARNNDASTKLQAAFAKLQPIGDLIGKLFNKLADYVADLVDKMMSAYEWIIKLANKLGIVSDEFVQATETSANLVRSIDALQAKEREYVVNSAYRNKEIAKLRAEAMATDDIDARIKMLEDAVELERKNLAEQQAIARQRYLNAKADAEKIDDTSHETLDKIAGFRAAMYQAEEAYYTGVRRLLKQLAKDKEEATAAMVAAGNEASELEAIYEKLFVLKQQYKEIAKPEPITDEEEEEILQPLNAVQQKMLELMKTGYSFADAQRVVAMEVKESYADAAGAIAFAFSESFGAVSELIQAFGEESEEAAKASKGFAILSIIASEAEAIANGVVAVTAAIAGATKAGAATGPAAPFTTPAFIAEMVGIVGSVLATTMANIVQAKKILDGGQFATGGIVGGTSYAGDNVAVRTNSGEMILTREQQKELFDMANGQSGAALEATRAAMISAMQAMPAPVMVYKEFEQFQKNVATYKEITAL